MKLSLTRDTLAYQLGVRPALQFRDMSSVPLKQVAQSLSEFMELDNAYDWIGPEVGKTEKAQGDPHKDAVIFYMLAHAAGILRKRLHPLEPLGKYEEVMDLHAEQMALRGTRMFYYLVAICVREARHASGFVGSKEHVLAGKYGSACVEFHKKVMAVNETGALNLLREDPPNVSVGKFLQYMTDQFKKSNCVYGHAFGGDPWSAIAKTAADFVHGDLSLELLLDKSFALAHNTAPIFNKPVLYTHYQSDLMKILDVQRSGQIPGLVKEKGVKCAMEKDVQELYLKLSSILGEEFSFPGYVDWHKVEEFAVEGHKYPVEKKTQTEKYGKPANTAAKEFVQKVKAKQADDMAAAEIWGLIQVFPKQYIKKYKRVKVAA